MNSSVYVVPILFYGKPELKLPGQLWAFPERPHEQWLKAIPRSHRLKWSNFYLSPRWSQWKEFSTAEEIFYLGPKTQPWAANTQHLVPWPTTVPNGTYHGTKRSLMWPRPSEKSYKLSLNTCESISAHTCIHMKPFHSDSSVWLTAQTSLQKQWATSFNCLLPLLNLKHHLSHLSLRLSH